MSDSKKIKISVIIPVYNTQAFIGQCLKSALNQTLKELEIVVINDCSTDNSLEIIRTFERNDKRIKLIDLKENKGNGYSRNLGIQKAQGKYILFLDSDDWLESKAAETLYHKAEEEKIEVVLFGFTNHLTHIKDKAKNTKVQLPKQDHKDVFEHFLLARNGVYPMPWIYLFSKKLIIENQITFSEGIYFEDLIFTAKALYNVKKISIFNKYPLYNYRIWQKSIMRSSSRKKINDNFEAHTILKTFLEQEGLFTQYRVAYLARFLTYCVFFSFMDYFRLRKTDRELNKFMKKLRKSVIVSQSNIDLVKNAVGKFDTDRKIESRVYELCHRFLSLIRHKQGYFIMYYRFKLRYYYKLLYSKIFKL